MSIWSKRGCDVVLHYDNLKIRILENIFSYNKMLVYNMKKFLNNQTIDGMFNIPQSDTTHIWEFNFANNYLAIHQADSFVIPEHTFLLPIVKTENTVDPFQVQIPFNVKFDNGYTLALNRVFMVDMGMPWDIALMKNADELNILEQREDAVWTRFLSDYFKHYTVTADIFENCVLKDLRIYTFNESTQTMRSNYIVGLNFLKRFNVFFDLKNSQIGLQPIKKFKRLINPAYRRFHYSTFQDSAGHTIVNKVADYSANYFKTAGLNQGDEIVSLNGIPYNEIDYDKYYEILDSSDTLVVNINHNTTPFILKVPVNKNEIQGD
jgi:hypothetical protein